MSAIHRTPAALLAAAFLILPAFIFLAGPASAGHLSGTSATYTLDADFDEGVKVNVDHFVADQLELSAEIEMFEFIWIAASTKGTVVKIDTLTGAVLGEYATAPGTMAKNPSRTTVDHKGNVWVGNRDESSVLNGTPMGSVVHIGLEENGECEDRNGNSLIDTSTGLGVVLPWTNLGGVDTDGGVVTAADECIIHYVRTNPTNDRHVSVDANNDVWVSGTGVNSWNLIDGDTGAILRYEPPVGCGGYGGLIDGFGVIWSASGLLRWDTAYPISSSTCLPHGAYGVCLDSLGNVWTTDAGSSLRKFDPSGALLGTFLHGSTASQGCAVGVNDHVFVAHSFFGPTATVGHVRNDGVFVGNVNVSSGPTGVAIDKQGKVWSTDYTARKASRIDIAGGPIGADGITPVGAVDYTSPNLGGDLYNYSDMTGWIARLVRRHGTWTITHDTLVPNAKWGTVGWTADVFSDGSLTVDVATSNDGITWSAPVPATNGGVPPVPDGQYIRAVVTFTRATTGESPILYDLSFHIGEPAAKCHAWGARIVETDTSGTGAIGDVDAGYSHSHVRAEARPGTWPTGPVPGDPPTKPTTPHASADAQQVGFDYSNVFLGLDVSSKTVFSECHGLSVREAQKGVFAHAYGRAGIQDFTLTLGANTVHAEALDFEAHAVGIPSGTYVSRACDIVELSTPISFHEYCPPPNTQISLLGATVTVTLNEQLAPVPVPGGYWLYGGAAVHIQIVTGVSTVDIWLGLVLVCVPGEENQKEPPVCRVAEFDPPVDVPLPTGGIARWLAELQVDPTAPTVGTDDCLPDCHELWDILFPNVDVRPHPCDPVDPCDVVVTAIPCDPICRVVVGADGVAKLSCVTPPVCPPEISSPLCDLPPKCALTAAAALPQVVAVLTCVPPGCTLYLDAAGSFLACDPVDVCTIVPAQICTVRDPCDVLAEIVSADPCDAARPVCDSVALTLLQGTVCEFLERQCAQAQDAIDCSGLRRFG